MRLEQYNSDTVGYTSDTTLNAIIRQDSTKKRTLISISDIEDERKSKVIDEALRKIRERKIS